MLDILEFDKVIVCIFDTGCTVQHGMDMYVCGGPN
jgi:hypothetical protein